MCIHTYTHAYTCAQYRYERLQATTTLKQQRLVVPKPLLLEAPDELVVEHNLEIFRQSGFELSVDMAQPAYI